MSLNRRIGVELDIDKALKDAERLEQKLLNIGKSAKGAGGFGAAIAKEMKKVEDASKKAEDSSKKMTEVITSEQKKQFSAFNKFNSLKDKAVKDSTRKQESELNKQMAAFRKIKSVMENSSRVAKKMSDDKDKAVKDSTANQMREFSKQLSAMRAVNKLIERSNKEAEKSSDEKANSSKKSAQQIKDSKAKEIAASKALKKQIELEALANAEAQQSVASYAKNSNDLSIQLDKTTQQTLNSIKVSDLKEKKEKQLAVATEGLLDLERVLVRESGIYNAAIFKTVQLQDKLENATNDATRAQIQAQLVRQKSVANLAKYNFEIAESRKELALAKIQAGRFASAVEATGIASARSVGGIRAIRGAAGQLGFQVQDIAVQAQMGTNALVILGQQGSQILSLLGPAGQIAGAGLAIFAAAAFALAPKLFNAKNAAEEFQKAMEGIEKTIEGVTEKNFKLSESLRDIAEVSILSAIGQLQSQLILANEELGKSGEIINTVFNDNVKFGLFKSLDDGLQQYRMSLDNTRPVAGELLTITGKLGEQFGLTGVEARRAGTSILRLYDKVDADPNVENITALSEQIASLISETNEATPAIARVQEQLNALLVDVKNGTKNIADLEELLKQIRESGSIPESLFGGSVSPAKNADSLAKYIEKLSQEVDQIRLNEVQVALYQARLEALSDARETNADATLDSIELADEDSQAIAELVNKKILLNKELEEEERLRSQAASFKELLDNYREETSLVGKTATQIELYNAAKAKGSALTEAETAIILANIEAKEAQLDIESRINNVRNSDSSLDQTIKKYEQLVENYGKSNEQLAIEQAIIQSGSSSDPRVRNLEALIAKYNELQEAQRASNERSGVIGSIDSDVGVGARELAGNELKEKLKAIREANDLELGEFKTKEEAKIAAQKEYNEIIDQLDKEEHEKKLAREIELRNAKVATFSSVVGALETFSQISMDYRQREVDEIKSNADEEGNLTDKKRKEYNAQIAAKEKQAKRQFDIMKALRASETFVSTGAAIMNALNNPDPITKWLDVAAVTATGAAQLASIGAQQFGGLGGGIPKPSAPPQRSSQTTNDNSFSGTVNVNIAGANVGAEDIQAVLEDIIDRRGGIVSDIQTSGEYRL